MNKIILVGRLVANPEFKIIESGKKICNFRIAVIESRKRDTLFLSIVAFDTLAETCQNWLQKASMVLIDGRLDCYKKEDKEYYSVVANNVQFLKNLKKKEINNQEEKES